MKPPLRQLVNALEVEQAAKDVLSPELFDSISGSDRRAFDRVTFRPKLMVDSSSLDLSLDLLGRRHFAPIIVGPVSGLERFHPDASSAWTVGAAAAKAAVMTAVAPDSDFQAALARAGQTLRQGATSVCLSLGSSPVHWDWQTVGKFRKSLGAPLAVKGVMTPGDAVAAAASGADAVIVSAYRVPALRDVAAPVQVLPAIVDAVAGKIPVLVDGSFRRGTDIFKALAFGATAVLVARPVLWGLAAYGAEGVQYVIEMLQTELGRTMVMCGTPNLSAIARSFVRAHKR
jgi:isopentenyl diphosphate isomerase/L-lactate dehydrogenase-like FMN-dependent dehydrogenase